MIVVEPNKRIIDARDIIMSDKKDLPGSKLDRMPTIQVEAIDGESLGQDRAETTEMLSREELFRNATLDRVGHRESKPTIPTQATRQLPRETVKLMREAAKRARGQALSVPGHGMEREDPEQTYDMKRSSILEQVQRQRQGVSSGVGESAYSSEELDRTLETVYETESSVRAQPRLFELEVELDHELRAPIPLDLAAHLRLRPGARVVIYLQSEEK